MNISVKRLSKALDDLTNAKDDFHDAFERATDEIYGAYADLKDIYEEGNAVKKKFQKVLDELWHEHPDIVEKLSSVERFFNTYFQYRQ
jgi:uncharacterized coiled-coil DUF342 family protein